MDVPVKFCDSRSNVCWGIRGADFVSNERTNVIEAYPNSTPKNVPILRKQLRRKPGNIIAANGRLDVTCFYWLLIETVYLVSCFKQDRLVFVDFFSISVCLSTSLTGCCFLQLCTFN